MDIGDRYSLECNLQVRFRGISPLSKRGLLQSESRFLRHPTSNAVASFDDGFQEDFGTVRVFDKSGNLLHKKEFFVDAQSGSRWLDLSGGDPPKPSKVFYIGGDGSGWEYLLPGSPGSGSSNRDCY